ncbi:SRPBCC family protein [Arthrobacter zhaoguopingii]|uniref:SRPBCC family protein n=1 Tax=Arthrobacter zhaoguopingii TaxID=2681491 RepID=UPI00135C72D9|nr:SRPBCC family protein [Arthrobacter zhaoguopingii]
MSTTVEKRILVNVPVSTAYNQWTQFEDFPQFMGGIKSVTQLSDDRLEWVAEIGGIRRQWEARILEQVPDRKVSWAATEGATNAGSVTFEDLGGSQTSVTLFLEYEPEGLVEKVGDKLNVVEKQAEGDLERFKAFIESEGYASGAWRGSVNEGGAVGTPGVEHAAESRGDSGKAGVSGKVVAGAVGLAAAAAVGVAAAGRSKDSDTEVDQTATPVTPVTTAPVTGTVTAPAGVASDDVADRDVSSPFDQTNGLADVDGESDGTAQSDTTSAADRLPDRGDDPLRGDRPIR